MTAGFWMPSVAGSVCSGARGAGATVTTLNLSEGHLESATATMTEADVEDAVDDFIAADILDPSIFPDGYFNTLFC